MKKYNPIICIEKEDILKEHNYKNYDRKLDNGFANSIIINAHDLIACYDNLDGDLYRFLSENNIEEHNLITEIVMFFPNGRMPNYSSKEEFESEMKKGRGTALLETIIEDARDDGCKGIFVHTEEEYMKRFLEKHSFTAVDEKKNHYVKAI